MKKIVLTLILIFIGLVSYAADYSTYKLDNNQTVVIKEVHDNPIVIIDTWIKTGSINETDENNGVAHFLEHLFFKGTKKHPVKEFDRILESKGAVTNAATSKDFTHYYILIPSKDFELALDLHSDMLLNPLIPRKELEKERKVVIEEIAKNNDNPINTLYKNMVKEFYKTHPYKRDVIGTKEVIETISREQILDFYNKWYTPENMTTVIIGDINTAKTLDLVKQKFNQPLNLNAKKNKIEYKLDKKPSSQIEKKEALNIETGYILIGFKGCHPMTNKDTYALDVLATILGDGKSSRLYKSLKEQKQIVHSISASHSSLKDDSLFYVMANYTTEDIERLKQSIFSEIEKIEKNEITQEELQKAKNIIERDTYYSRESVSNIAGEIGYTITLTDNTDYYKNYLDNIRKVTVGDVKKVAKEYLNVNNAVISLITPSKNAKKVSPEQPNKTYTAQTVSKNNSTTKYLLENQASLLITKNPSNDIIAIEIASRGGNSIENKIGTGLITAESLMKGTYKYKNQELSQLLEENGIIISPSVQGDSFNISVKFTKNEKDIALDILREIILNASLDAFDIEKVKADKMVALKNRYNTPDAIAFDEFKTALWQNTPYGNTAKVLEGSIPTIWQEDVIDYYNKVFDAKNIVISINGNIEEQEYINYFSSILTSKDNPKVNLSDYKNRFKPLLNNKKVKIEKDSQATWLLIGWLTDGVNNERDWASLQVINAILGSGMGSRLFTNLRDQQSLAYQVGSNFSANVNKGAFALYIATNPATAQQAKISLFNEIENLKKEFVTDKELSEAKDKLLGNFVLSMETNMEKASVINALEIQNRSYKFIDKYPELINSITVRDIIRTANKYFNQPYVFTMAGPKDSVDKL